jgi:hypothetical protein
MGPDDLPNETGDFLARLLRDHRSGWRVEPVYWDGARYRYAIAFTCRLLELPAIDLGDAITDFAAGDRMLVIGAPVKGAEKSRFEHLQSAGVLIHFGIDELPMDWRIPSQAL